MLHLEHINLVVKSIPDTLTFYQAAFPHWKVRGKAPSSWFGKPRNWLHFGDEYQYLTFNDQGTGKNRELSGHTIGLAHFAFVTSNIDAIIQRLKNAGFTPDKFGKPEQYRRNVYFIDPNGFEVEFVQYESDIPQQRNEYIYEENNVVATSDI